MKISERLRALWRKVNSAKQPPKDLIFDGVWRRQQWRIDETGIHEFRQGHPYVTVYWADLAGFAGQKLRAINGAGSSVYLPQDRLAKFRRALYTEWERRFPERYRAHRALELRGLAWLVFLWLPLIFAAPCLPIYFLPHFAVRRGVSTIDSFTYANRLAIVSGVTLCFFWSVYGYARWKFQTLGAASQKDRLGKH